MTEDESYKERLTYLSGRLEAVETLLQITVATLSEEQRDFIQKQFGAHTRQAEKEAAAKDTDLLRDKSSAAYEADVDLANALDVLPEVYEGFLSR